MLNKNDIFTERFILNLHKRMYGHVWKWVGQYRKTNKNIGVEPYLIVTELHKLLGDVQYWQENNIYSVQELAVIFHHRLVKIHLFANGNGRHARLFADVVVAKYGGNKLGWGGDFNLTDDDSRRKAYILGLRKADSADYGDLLSFAL